MRAQSSGSLKTPATRHDGLRASRVLFTKTHNKTQQAA